jgi:hypothetical protein
MAIVDASPQDLRDALLSLRDRYLALEEPRRWYSALVCAVLVKAGRLPEWTDWMLEPPPGAPIQMTPAVDAVVNELFGTRTPAVLREIDGGVRHFFHDPQRVIVDPLRQSAHPTEGLSLCVVVDKQRLDVPLTDPSWVWNDAGADLPEGGYGTALPEIKHAGDYGAQQGIRCDLPADRLFTLGPEGAEGTMRTPRQQCGHWAMAEVPRRRKATDVGDPPLQMSPVCTLTMQQCASKGNGVPGPGGPRALVPDTESSERRLMSPGAFDRILEDANPNGAPLPSSSDMALVLDYFAKGHGTALDANRLHQLIAPQHFDVLFEP